MIGHGVSPRYDPRESCWLGKNPGQRYSCGAQKQPMHCGKKGRVVMTQPFGPFRHRVCTLSTTSVWGICEFGMTSDRVAIGATSADFPGLTAVCCLLSARATEDF